MPTTFRILSCTLVLCILVASTTFAEDAVRPNIVWIIADDLGPELGCYGEKHAATPHIDQLAAEGTKFTHMFATSPVCSSSRTAFITGCYQTTIGGHHHRTREKPALKKGRTVFEVFRNHGYFVTNSSWPITGKRGGKTDYNFISSTAKFDGNNWSQRAKGQPFFSQIQIHEPHRKFGKDTNKTRAQQLTVPPKYPDHPVTRADWANYLATVEVLDRKVGEVVDRLEKEKLLDATIIMFFGDHGRPHVWGKQWLYEGGIHVPFIVRIPQHFRAISGQTGSTDDRLLSMIDIAATSLAVAGIDVPDFMQGISFHDLQSPGRQQVFAARDRCGDAIDRIRAIRTRDFKYIRNFMPERPYMQQSGYKTAQYPVITLLKVLHARGQLTPEQAQFMAPIKPKEELYDLKNDPFELHNLASSAKHRTRLENFRRQLAEWQSRTSDLGMQPEGDDEFIADLLKEKQAYFERAMKKRGLSANVSPVNYLEWWKQELGLTKTTP